MKKILVANRGEIAVRILHSIHALGFESVAVYSDADRDAPHVVLANEAVHLGAAQPSESYLNIPKILAAAEQTGTDAIHPGYGFLSENPSFARAIDDSGLTFIGPPASAIEVMGSKLAAKEAVKGYDIPMVPGTDEPLSDIEEARKIAEELRFPVLIKASAGGGGKGMRIVHKASEFEAQIARARSEAMKAFGDDSVFVEKYIESPKHIEVQVLADKHGNYVHLFERECSIQRRHQKVIEEAPSPVVSPEMRSQIGAAAVRVAQACGYTGAGTVEFIVDEELNFYFLEMNTRLQVEHPVTEMTTGIDLVEQQIRVAMGEQLAFSQENLLQHGHSIELRVYAEDPANDFLPSIGQLTKYNPPEGEGIRVDDGYREGMVIPLEYDPLISKLIVFAEDRNKAIDKMLHAIAHYDIQGVQTTLSFGAFVMRSEAFRSGKFDTHYVDIHFTPGGQEPDPELERIAAIFAGHLHLDDQKHLRVTNKEESPWRNRKV